MTDPGIEVLLVGEAFRVGCQTLTERLRQFGFQCHFADTLRAACEMLSSHRVAVVLSAIKLPDGSGFALMARLARLHVSAFLYFPVANSCYWLPVIDRGQDCCGSAALRPAEFARMLEELARGRMVSPIRDDSSSAHFG
jgi:DNA-binding NarL/FixJ family response regulator